MRRMIMTGLVLTMVGLAGMARAEEAVRIPSKYLLYARGYEKALALQQQTGADIFVYVSHKVPAGAKGLCNWWEKHAMQNGDVVRALEGMIKVELPLPSDGDTEELAATFRLWKGPTLVVVSPSGHKRSIRVFDWPDGKPELKEPDEIAALIAGADGD
jgi:hypothetical protein